MDDVKRYVDIAQSDLPSESETPEVQSAEFDVEITRVAVSGLNLSELRPLRGAWKENWPTWALVA